MTQPKCCLEWQNQNRSAGTPCPDHSTPPTDPFVEGGPLQYQQPEPANK